MRLATDCFIPGRISYSSFISHALSLFFVNVTAGTELITIT